MTPSADQAPSFDRESAYSVRSVPIRIYLPNGPVIQDLAPALLEDGKPISPTGILISMYQPFWQVRPTPFHTSCPVTYLFYSLRNRRHHLHQE